MYIVRIKGGGLAADGYEWMQVCDTLEDAEKAYELNSWWYNPEDDDDEIVEFEIYDDEKKEIVK